MRKIDYQGKIVDAIPLDFELIDGQETWLKFKLSDGAIVRVKFEVQEWVRVVDIYTPQGEPLYVFTHSMTSTTRAPEEMQKHNAEAKEKKKLQ